MIVREYGSSGPWVVLLHGGPGGAGYLAPLAQELADSFRVLEPWQRGSGPEQLTVATHVDDLEALLDDRCTDAPLALVGHSWGAMLALAFTAARPDRCRALVLIGCGTFDVASRERLEHDRAARMTEELRRRLERLPAEIPDPDERLRRVAELTFPLDSHDLLPEPLKLESCDARAHEETWMDMLRLQTRGTYPAAFAAIQGPVLMLHGADDPHPGRTIRDGLAMYLRALEYRELDRCGHYPWLEKHAREQFLEILRDWLDRTLR